MKYWLVTINTKEISNFGDIDQYELILVKGSLVEFASSLTELKTKGNGIGGCYITVGIVSHIEITEDEYNSDQENIQKWP